MKNKLIIACILAFAFLSAVSVAAQNGKTYRALLTQSGTNAPYAKVLQNDFAGTPTFSRIAPGVYRLELPGAFPDEENIFGLGRAMLDSSFGTTIHFVRYVWDDEGVPGDGLLIQTFDVNMATGKAVYSDGRLNRTNISIVVFEK